MLKRVFQDNVFEMKTAAVLGWDDETEKWFRKTLSDGNEDPEFIRSIPSHGGFTFFESRLPLMIIWLPRWSPTQRQLSALSHECGHASFYACEYFNIRVAEGEANETFCYLLGFFWESCYSSFSLLTKKQSVL